jgi:hypothetical protein
MVQHKVRLTKGLQLGGTDGCDEAGSRQQNKRGQLLEPGVVAVLCVAMPFLAVLRTHTACVHWTATTRPRVVSAAQTTV